MDPPLRAALLVASAHPLCHSCAGGSVAAGDRPDGRHAVSLDRSAHRPLVSWPDPTASDWTRGIPFLDSKVRQSTERKKAEKLKVGLETAYCAETVAITYEEMGLLETEKHYNWFDPGSFWSGDSLPLAPGYRLGDEIAVVAD